MGDFNADPDPDEHRIRQVAFGFKFAPLDDLKIDQFSTPTALKVYHLVKKNGSTRLQVLVDPANIPHI